MNDDITLDRLSDLTVWHGGKWHTWKVTDIEVSPDEDHENQTFFTLEGDGQKVKLSLQRHSFGDSLKVVRGLLKSAVIAELERQK